MSPSLRNAQYTPFSANWTSVLQCSSVLQQSGYYHSDCVVKSQHVANCCLVQSCMMQIVDEGEKKPMEAVGRV